MSNLRKSIHYLQQAIRESNNDEINKKLLEALDIILCKQDELQRR